MITGQELPDEGQVSVDRASHRLFHQDVGEMSPAAARLPK